MTKKAQILLTNDDGIRSPGLWAAASALEHLGFVHVVAPREQSSGMGRSLPNTSSGVITPEKLMVNGKEWTVYAVDGTPAQAVLHGVMEIMEQKPALVVSGINYGENVGSGVTISGTVGAALEAAALGMPALAVSLQTDPKYHLSYSSDIDFRAAAYFTQFFARILLTAQMPEDVDVLKVEVPANATPETPWRVTRISKVRYYEAIRPDRTNWSEPGKIGYRKAENPPTADEHSDSYVLHNLGLVSVTPISLDMTSRIALNEFEQQLRDWAEDEKP